jgi:type I restriction enzyme M protein
VDIVQKLWGFCNTLRHDGMNYGDYIEQLTYLLFLKLAEEQQAPLPSMCTWFSLRSQSEGTMLAHYAETLRELSGKPGILGDIFSGAVSRFRQSSNLKRLISLIDDTEWARLDIDLQGEAYEGLLQKYAAEQKGAGQYFTPRPVIRAAVQCLRPDIREESDFTVHDPAAGTGGFLIGAAEWMRERSGAQLSLFEHRRWVQGTYSGAELVLETRRLALMNLYVHGIEGEIYYGDSLAAGDRAGTYTVVLTNPPFGSKGAGDIPERSDFRVATPNKQLNFVQHVISVLKPGGRAAMVLPDNVLFEDRAGREVRSLLMQDCDLHTILRLPVGTFSPYSPGVKANVLFFRKGLPTEETWIYDLRTKIPNLTKGRPISSGMFEDFVRVYGPIAFPRQGDREQSDRFHAFSRQQIADREDNLDIFWLDSPTQGDGEDTADLEVVLGEIYTQLETVLDSVNEIAALMSRGKSGEIGTGEA